MLGEKVKRLRSRTIGTRLPLRPISLMSMVAVCLLTLIFFTKLAAGVETNQNSSAFLPSVIREQIDDANQTFNSWSGPIGISPLNDQVWVVNPDSGSVSVVDGDSRLKLAEIETGGEPWSLAFSADGAHVFVIDRAGGRLHQIDGELFTLIKSEMVGAEPVSVLIDPVSSKGFVSLSAGGEIVVFDSETLSVQNRLPVPPVPYGLALWNNNLLVTHFLAQLKSGGEEARDDGKEGLLTLIDVDSETVVNQIQLAPNLEGFPSLMPSISVHEDRAWLPHLRAAPDTPNGLTEIVFSAVTTVDLTQEKEFVDAFLPLNDQDLFGSPINNPWVAIPSPNGETLYIVAAGSDLVEAVNIQNPSTPELIGFLPTGLNPRGMAISADGQFGYVMNYLSRSVTVLDLGRFEVIDEIVVTEEPYQPDLLNGKILFNTAANPKMSRASWVSCASCHPDGGTDGITWMFPDGPRQTPPLWNSANTLPWHWSAALDEMQDVEDTIQTIQHGIGLAPGGESAPLDINHAGRSEALDDLALFMAAGVRIPSVAGLNLDEDQLVLGRELFVTAGCAECHGGVNWTQSRLNGLAGTLDPDRNGMIDDVLFNVGTVNLRDIKGETGFDIPSLLNVGLTAPYFHDGSAGTLQEVILSGHPTPGSAPPLFSAAELDALATFLASIGSDSVPIELDLEDFKP